MFKIMIIEDDVFLASLLKESLEKYEYEVLMPENLRNIEECINKAKPDMVLLDVNLPYYDGFYICKSIRKNSNIPIIIISARSGDMDQVMGIELGADDYITKPFSLDVLIVKIMAVLRRSYGDYSEGSHNKLEVKSFYVDQKNFRMYYMEQSMELTKTEFKLLNKLFENKDKVVSRECLLEEMWDENFIASDNTLTVNITRIKSKLLLLGIIDMLKTKRGVGYILDTSVLKEKIYEKGSYS